MLVGEVKAGESFWIDGREYVYSGVNSPEGAMACIEQVGKKLVVSYVDPVTQVDTYERMQRDWIKTNGIKQGSRVRVTRIAEDSERGWNNSWNPMMDISVGKTMEVDDVDEDTGIRVGKQCFRYPYFVLEAVAPETEPVDPGEGYRLLDDDEYVEAGDQWNGSVIGTVGDWRKISVTGISETACEFLCRNASESQVAVRRAVKVVSPVRYRNYTSDELADLVGEVFVDISSGYRYVAICSEKLGLRFALKGLYTAYELRETFRNLDGSTCGVEIGGEA